MIPATIPDIEVIEHLDFDAQLGCESIFHGKSGDHAGDTAEYLQISRCVHGTGFRCAAFVAALRERIARDPAHQTICDACGELRLASDLVFVPISNIK